MKNQNKKGFTIVELVIVIAVIAILAAVLIPTFVGLVDEANKSADQQAVNQMNKALAMNEALADKDIFAVYDALEEVGMSAKNYKPLAKDMYFFWDAKLNRVLYVDKDMKVVAPAEYEGRTNTEAAWFSLSATIETKAPADTDYSDGVTVTSGAELMYVVEKFNDNTISEETLTIDLGEKTIDMMGANMMMANGEDGNVTKSITITNGTIKNITNIDAAYIGEGGEGHNGIYYAGGLFGRVDPQGTVTISNVTVENVHIKNTNVSLAGILFANVNSGFVVIDNVTVKDSSVIAHRSVGALVGAAPQNAGKVEFKNTTTMDNVKVQTVGGRSGLIVGYLSGEQKVQADGSTTGVQFADGAKIVLKNDCTFTMYACEQNKDGAGLSGNLLTSTYDGKDGPLTTKYYFAEGAYATGPDDQTGSTVFDGKVTVE